VAARALELLDEERALEQAAETGALLLSRLRALAARHPSVIEEVRGAGLMLGMEWRALEFEGSSALRDLRSYGWLGYALSGYLLRAHGIRVAPTLSSSLTLRLEPAYSVPPEAIERLMAALEELCRLLEQQDAAGLLAPCMALGAPREEREAPRPVRRAPLSGDSCPHVGFVGHLIDPSDLALWDESFARLDVRGRAAFLDRIGPIVEPVVTQQGRLTSIDGRQTVLTFIGLAVPSARFYAALRTPDRLVLRGLVQRGVDLAAELGCSVVGLGGYCSIVTRNGRELRPRGLGLTTGNGYTVAAGLDAMRATASELGIDWGRARAAVVGATGNIGSVLAELLAAEVGSLVLLGRESRLRDLEALAGRLRAALDADCPIEVGADLHLCRDAQLVVAASNQASCLLYPEHLGRGPVVINDLSVPSDVAPSVARERPEARVIRGGVVRVPLNPAWRVPGVPLPPGEMYACMAETVLMGLEGQRTHGSLGQLTPERVRAAQEMAARHGFSSVRTVHASSY
jgi:predicted amino acid dehydrogenase